MAVGKLSETLIIQFKEDPLIIFCKNVMQKCPLNWHLTLNVIPNYKINLRNEFLVPKHWLKSNVTAKLNGGHLWFMQITGIAQGCHSGNQAKLSLGTHVTMILSKNHTLLTATRSTIRLIRVATGLLIRTCINLYG